MQAINRGIAVAATHKDFLLTYMLPERSFPQPDVAQPTGAVTKLLSGQGS